MASCGASCLTIAALLLAACASSAAATSYTVGDASGWTIGVDYTSWAGSKSFKVGDSLGKCMRVHDHAAMDMDLIFFRCLT
jgi:ssDNA-binding replication factor A large subunit